MVAGSEPVERNREKERGREEESTREDGWTGELGRFDEAKGPPVFSSLSILEADSRVVPRRLLDLLSLFLSLSVVSFYLYKDGTKIHRHWPANCPGEEERGGRGRDGSFSTWVALACRALIRF